ncbi:MAG: serine/threonine-protein kinase, partial [Pseudomonadota bacterium]
MSKTCDRCGAQAPDDASFCPECGAPIHQGEDSAGPVYTVGGVKTVPDSPTKPRRGGAAVPDLKPGAVFADRYEIEDVVGAGGMGVVYKAKDRVSNQTIALKLIRPERMDGEGAMKRLIEEGVRARSVRHPNIVAVYDVAEADGVPFVSMEYVDGKSLRGWHRDKLRAGAEVPVRVAARIVAEALDGLKAAHDAGVVHLDLKPENIVLTGEPDDKSAAMKILDFGIGKAIGVGIDSG